MPRTAAPGPAPYGPAAARTVPRRSFRNASHRSTSGTRMPTGAGRPHQRSERGGAQVEPVPAPAGWSGWRPAAAGRPCSPARRWSARTAGAGSGRGRRAAPRRGSPAPPWCPATENRGNGGQADDKEPQQEDAAPAQRRNAVRHHTEQPRIVNQFRDNGHCHHEGEDRDRAPRQLPERGPWQKAAGKAAAPGKQHGARQQVAPHILRYSQARHRPIFAPKAPGTARAAPKTVTLYL